MSLLLLAARAVRRGPRRVSLAAGLRRGPAGPSGASAAGMEELLSRSVPPLPPYETKEKAPPPAELRSAEFVRYYRALEAGPPRAELLTRLARDFGVDHGRVAEFSAKVLQAREQQRELGALLQAEDRLRYYLNPQYRGLFQHLGRLEGGLRFLVELRGDLVEGLASKAVDGPHVKVRAGLLVGGSKGRLGVAGGGGVWGFLHLVLLVEPPGCAGKRPVNLIHSWGLPGVTRVNPLPTGRGTSGSCLCWQLRKGVALGVKRWAFQREAAVAGWAVSCEGLAGHWRKLHADAA